MSLPTHSVLQSFFDYLKFEKRYSRHTLIAYQNDLSAFFDFIEMQYGSMPLTGINHPIVRSWLAGLKDDGVTSKSINRKISSLRSFFKYQMKEGSIKMSPMTQVISPKISKRLPVFVKEEETKAIVKALSGSTDTWKLLNAKMLVTIFYATGMRLAELIGLKENQLDLGKKTIKVLGKGNKERIIPVSPELAVSIREYLQMKKRAFGVSGGELLVTEKGKKLYPKYAYLLVKQVLGEASTLAKKSPHVLRHSFATHLMDHGADLNAVKELLGHSSLASTQVYTHNTIKKLKEVHKKAHPRG